MDVNSFTVAELVDYLSNKGVRLTEWLDLDVSNRRFPREIGFINNFTEASEEVGRVVKWFDGSGDCVIWVNYSCWPLMNEKVIFEKLFLSGKEWGVEVVKGFSFSFNDNGSEDVEDGEVRSVIEGLLFFVISYRWNFYLFSSSHLGRNIFSSQDGWVSTYRL